MLITVNAGRELLPSFPYAVHSGIGRPEGCRVVGYLQGAVAAGGLEEDDQEAV